MCGLYDVFCIICFFKQKTAYEMRISDWSSDVCSSDLNRYPDDDQRVSSPCFFLPRLSFSGSSVSSTIVKVGSEITTLLSRTAPSAILRRASPLDADRKSVV